MVRYDINGVAYDDYGNPLQGGMNMPRQGYPDMFRQHGMVQQRAPRVSKREVLTFLQQQLCASELELVEDAGAEYARHVCQNGTKVYLLPKQVYPFQTPQGVLNIVYYRCEVCGKLIVDSNFM